MSSRIYFGAGCFWGVEEKFRLLNGVTATEVGYGGGEVPHPTYRQVCDEETGHIELCRVDFDESQISIIELLEFFFSIHDPTTMNRQGLDIGPQYRSVIFTTTQKQRELALELVARYERESRFKDRIVTDIKEFINYYPAEEYHQKYVQKNGWTCIS